MDKEEIIRRLKNISEHAVHVTGEPPFIMSLDDGIALYEAVRLLKEQEAKQIVRKQCKKEYEDGSIEYFAEWYCPHCELLILRGFDNPSIKFCYKCGKPILWEGR